MAPPQTAKEEGSSSMTLTTPSRRQEGTRTRSRSAVDPGRLHLLPQQKEPQGPPQWTGPFFFIQAADTQYGMIEGLRANKEPGLSWDEEIRLSELLIGKCNRMKPKPKFMVVCGDLTDAIATGDEQTTELRQRQVEDFKRVFAELDDDIPLICVCGNHDIGNAPTMESIDRYKRDFGDDYFYFSTNGCLFIVINSQFYENREWVEDYARQQDEWLIQVLKKCKDYKFSFIFEHIPWFLHDIHEEDEYFNIARPVRLRWIERFHKAGISKILCGHYHRNAGGRYLDMEVVVTSAVGAQLGKDVSGARIVRCTDHSVLHEYYALEELPEEIDI